MNDVEVIPLVSTDHSPYEQYRKFNEITRVEIRRELGLVNAEHKELQPIESQLKLFIIPPKKRNVQP